MSKLHFSGCRKDFLDRRGYRTDMVVDLSPPGSNIHKAILRYLTHRTSESIKRKISNHILYV